MSVARLLAPLAFMSFGAAAVAQVDSSVVSTAQPVEFFNPHESHAGNDTTHYPQRLVVVANARGNIESITYYDDTMPLNEIGRHYDIDKAQELRSNANRFDMWDTPFRMLRRNDPDKLQKMVAKKASKSADLSGVPRNTHMQIILKADKVRARF